MGRYVALTSFDAYGVETGNEALDVGAVDFFYDISSYVFLINKFYDVGAIACRGCVYTCYLLVDCVSYGCSYSSRSISFCGFEYGCDRVFCCNDIRYAFGQNYRSTCWLANDVSKYWCFFSFNASIFVL